MATFTFSNTKMNTRMDSDRDGDVKSTKPVGKLSKSFLNNLFSAALTTDSNDNVKKEPGNHSHDPPGVIGIEALKAKLKIRITGQELLQLNAGGVIRNVRSDLPDAVSDLLPSTESLKGSVRYYCRNAVGPANPKTE